MRRQRPDKNSIKRTAACAAARARLCVYADGGLDATERNGMNRHFADCAACRAELATQRQAESALTAARFALPPPGDLRADFYRRLQTENSARSKRPANQWRLAVPPLAAGLFALLWRPGLEGPMRHAPMQYAPTKRNHAPIRETPLTAALPQNSAKAASMRRGPSETKAGPVASSRFMARIAESPAVAGKAPELPALPSLQFEVAQKLAAVTAQQAPDARKPAQYALADAQTRQKAPYALSLSSAGMAAQRVSGNLEPFYFEAQTVNSARLEKTVNRNDAAAKPDAQPAPHRFGAERLASLFADSALESSAAADLPIMLADAAQVHGQTESVEALNALQITAGLSLGLDRSKVETPAADEVDFEVRDDERGFASRTRVTGSIEQRQDGETLTIEAEADNGS